MGTNDCRECRALLSPFIEGELPPDGAARLARHLESCRECRRELEELRRTVELLRRLPQEPAPPEILRGVREAIRRPSLRARWESWTFAWWPRAVAQVVAVVLVGLTVVLIQERSVVLREEALRPARIEPAVETPKPAPPVPSSPAPAPREDRVQRLKAADIPAGKQAPPGRAAAPSPAEGTTPVPLVREEGPAASRPAAPLPDLPPEAATSGGGDAVSPSQPPRETALTGTPGEDKPSRPDSDAAPMKRKATSPEVRPLSMPMMQYQQQAAAPPATAGEGSAAADRGTLPQRERGLPENALTKAGGGQVAGLKQEIAAMRAGPEAPAGLLLCLRAPAGYDWLAELTGLARDAGARSAPSLEAVKAEERRRLNDLAGGEGTVSSLVFTMPAANRDDLLRVLRERTPLAILDQRETLPEGIGGEIRITLLVWQEPR